MVLLNSSSCKFGWKPENFEFISLKGDKNSLYNMSGLNGILIMFICNHCPYVRSIEEKIAIETFRLKEIKVNSLAIMSNDQSAYPEDSDSNLLEQASRANFDFDYIVDSDQSIAKNFDALCTPEFYFFDKDLKLHYRGRLDSNGKDPEMGEPELYYAIEEVIAKGYCSTQQSPSMGCSIKWKS
jgi:thioredoxin-related protein|tara:strand:- start:239 stop:787 length:549 start_codon:yes stop_codon:yes gene_type:complete